MHTPEQMRETLLDQYNYALDHIPISFGGLFDPTNEGDCRYQTCLSTVMNSQSICSAYYTQEYQPITTKSSSNILFFNTDHHPHHQQNSDGNARRTSSPTSLVAIVALRRNHDSASNQSAAAAAAAAARKRQSSSSSDSEKRRRSNESLIEEEEPPIFTYIPQDISFNQLQPKNNSIINENSLRTPTNHHEKKSGMSDYDNRDVKQESKRTTNHSSKSSNTNEFLAKTQSQIRQEYRKLPNPPARDTHAAKDERNLNKSRYRDVIPGEATRVKLQPDVDDKSDFINANYVSGYNNQERAYIFTQGPLESTVKDFWRMVWQENISIIVMTTNIRESNTIKCYPYWPAEAKSILNAGLYQIQNEESEKFPSFIVTKLTLRKKNHPETRTIYHAHYIKWPDHGIPPTTSDALDFLERVNYYKRLTQTQAPILLHCSAGIGRTGTFCAIDIGIKRYLEKKPIDMPSTVIKMRSERAGSVQTEDQYVFAHLALMDYIKQNEQQTTPEKELPNVNDDVVKIQDNRNSLVDLDDNIHKTRTKKQPKKSSDLGATSTLPTIHSSKNTNLQEPTTSQRGKTLSDSNVSSIQFVAPSTTVQQNDSNPQRLSTEYNSSVPPTTTGNINHKKARK